MRLWAEVLVDKSQPWLYLAINQYYEIICAGYRTSTQ